MAHQNGSEEGLVVRVEPLEMAKGICELMVERVRVVDGTLELDVDPSYGAAIITVLAKKGMRGAICAPRGSRGWRVMS